MHEFLQLCELIELEPYIAGNVGSAGQYKRCLVVEYLNHAGGSTLSDLEKTKWASRTIQCTILGWVRNLGVRRKYDWNIMLISTKDIPPM